TMSPIAPAGRAKRKNGSDEAVCVSATNVGSAPSQTMSQAAPTLCMKVPMSDNRSAMKRLLNIGVRRGAQRDGGVRSVTRLLDCVLEQAGEPLALNERRLFRFVQPFEDFFDDDGVLDAVGFGDVDVRERSGDVAAPLHERSQGERRAVER